MAPEQFRREPLTIACDVYAFGITAYEMLTGRNCPLRSLSAPLAGGKPGWDEILWRCVQSAPAKRPASVMEVVEWLECVDD